MGGDPPGYSTMIKMNDACRYGYLAAYHVTTSMHTDNLADTYHIAGILNKFEINYQKSLALLQTSGFMKFGQT